MWPRLIPLASSCVVERTGKLWQAIGAFAVACVAWAMPLAVSAANFTVSPTNLAFGSVPVGATGTMIVTITNTSGVSQTPNYAGGAPLDSTNFGGSQNCAGKTLAAGGSCQFTYTFTPKTLGAKSSSTTIQINSETFQLTMSGTGISAFTVIPTNLAFGNVLVGGTGTIVVTITNTSGVSQTPNYAGGAPLDSTNFGGSQNCAGKALAAGGSCQFTYTFTPKTLGAKSSSTTIQINSETFQLTMSGTGVGGFTLAPTSIDFGAVLVGNASSNAVVTLTNTSGAPLPVAVTGGDVAPHFSMTENCNGSTLGVGASCRFVYVFKPITTGFAVATSILSINGKTYSIQLLGRGSVLPPVASTVIEFYNASLDHYFITHLTDEIAQLDAGVVIKGWQRTGRSFKAFETAQSGTTDICRIYIIPVHGDSHFFGRGQQECDETMAAHPDFILEASKFMALFLPVAGACPAGTLPVYRVFSNRPDANHRYMIERTLRDAMVADGWLAEGDGPDLVVLCAPS